MFGKKKEINKYVTAPSTDDKQASQQYRIETARKCVRSIRQHPVLSAEWLQLVDSLEQLAKIAALESFIPYTTTDKKDAQGTKASSV